MSRCVGQRRGDAEIRHDDPGADVAREDVDRGAAPREVLDHLRGDRLGVGAHALRRDAVVGGEGEDHGRLDARQRVARDHDDPHGQLLQAAEAPARLREAVEPLARRRAQPAVGRHDGRDEPVEGGSSAELDGAPPVPAGDFTATGHPATMSTTSSAARATAWLTRPRASRNRRPSAVSGCTPQPTSFDTRIRAKRGARDDGRQLRRLGLEIAVGELWPFLEEVCDPEVQAIHDDARRPRPARAASADGSATGTSTVRQVGGRSARWRAIRAAISGSPASAVATNTTRPPSARGAGDGERALPARGRRPGPGGSGGSRRTRAGTPAGRRRVRQPGPPLEDRFGALGSQAGLLALGSSYSPRPSRRRAPVGSCAGFVPDHSDGVAAVSHRLPSWPRDGGAPGTP